MKDDELLARIRDHVREERADDAALEANARGEAVGDLERRAAADPGLAAVLAATRPLGADVEARIVTRVQRRAPARFLRIARIAGPLALAAGLVLWVTVARRSGADVPSGLPEYVASVSADQAMRGPAAPAQTLRVTRVDAPFEIVVRPDTAPGLPVVAYAFGVGEGEPNAIDGLVEVSPEGSIRLRGRTRALLGARELRIVIGTTPTPIARFEDALGFAVAGARDTRARVVRVAITRE